MSDLTDFQRGGYFVDLPTEHPIDRDVYRRHAVRILAVDLLVGDFRRIVGAVLFPEGPYEKLAIWGDGGSFERLWSIVPQPFDLQPGDPALRLQRE